ncbi:MULTISPECIES: LysE family translocator [Croceitalea]|uniref:LysE family translocator n=1 Tax=Croceitalea vernalis TaxID=3075599 RepID=A0ABU3BJ18_9FLAO|nr:MULTISPECIES: LysE family translocator [unclassified Croceitalea]MDT0540322.1 LysE family translocator [Croceitalea sp. P059]MDT0622157.1 LysE family translocator [Croceitalea sp. P007]
MNYEILIAFIFATAALAISPGPDNIFVLVQSIANGKKYGLATTAGLMTGCLIHTTLLAFGVSVLIKENESLFFIIKLFGALYLLFLSYKVFKSDAHIDFPNQTGTKKSFGKLFQTGFWMNVLNPKVTIFFLAFFPGFLFSESLNTVIQFYVLGFLFIGVSSIIFGSIAILAGKISKYITKNSSAGVFLKWMQIMVFISIAVYLLLSDK